MRKLVTHSTKPVRQPSEHAEEYVTLDRNVIYDFQFDRTKGGSVRAALQRPQPMDLPSVD